MYNQDKIAKLLNISRTTLHNWKKEKPYLYKIIMNHFNNEQNGENELLKLFDELTEIEKEMYISEIKARVLRKKLDK